MYFTNINGILTSPNWTFFRYKVIITIGIGLACVIFGVVKVVKLPKQLFFSKDKDKGLSFDLRLK